MKKYIIITCLMIVFLLVGCKKTTAQTTADTTTTISNETTSNIVETKLLSVEEIMSNYSSSMLKCSSYSLGKYMKPVWDNQIIYNETAMFFKDKDGSIKDKTLLYPIAKILEVRDSTLNILYEEGKDYSVVDGKLHYLEGSSIWLTDYNDYYLDAPHNSNAAFASIKEEGKYYYYSEGDYFSKKQVAVTYIRTAEWEGPTIKRDETKLPKTMAKLRNQEPLKIVFYGDSIMEGCNASSFNKVEPNMPMLSKLITKRLISEFGYSNIEEINTAVGGWTTNNGVQSGEMKERVLDKMPDLVVIGFGANDATFNMDKNTFGANIQSMMRKVLQVNPDCEFILISSPRPNDDAVNAQGNKMYGDPFDSYVEVFTNLSEDPSVAFADMTTLSKYVLTIKDWVDVTSNNINHPSDFLIRLEAQLVCSIFF